jgi:hypothetical protein
MYILGGLSKSLISTGQLFRFNLKEPAWEIVSQVQVGRYKYTLEGHASTIMEGTEPCIISYGGFY